jgi:hypothetical protein
MTGHQFYQTLKGYCSFQSDNAEVKSTLSAIHLSGAMLPKHTNPERQSIGNVEHNEALLFLAETNFFSALDPLKLSGRSFSSPSNHDVVCTIIRINSRSGLKQTPPPVRRVKGARAVVQGRVNVRKEIPNMSNNDTHDLILRNSAVQYKTETHQNPGQIRRSEHK